MKNNTQFISNWNHLSTTDSDLILGTFEEHLLTWGWWHTHLTEPPLQPYIAPGGPLGIDPQRLAAFTRDFLSYKVKCFNSQGCHGTEQKVHMTQICCSHLDIGLCMYAYSLLLVNEKNLNCPVAGLSPLYSHQVKAFFRRGVSGWGLTLSNTFNLFSYFPGVR